MVPRWPHRCATCGAEWFQTHICPDRPTATAPPGIDAVTTIYAGARQTGKTEQTWPHYFSTYCMHDLHDDCRLTCKHCAKACRCACHGRDDA